MLKGGYKIINFREEPIDATNGSTVIGMYERISGAYGGQKSTLVSGLNNAGTIIEDFYTKFALRDGSFYGLISLDGSTATFVKVESNDTVSIVTESIGGGGGGGSSTDFIVLDLGGTASDPVMSTYLADFDFSIFDGYDGSTPVVLSGYFSSTVDSPSGSGNYVITPQIIEPIIVSDTNIEFNVNAVETNKGIQHTFTLSCYLNDNAISIGGSSIYDKYALFEWGDNTLTYDETTTSWILNDWAVDLTKLMTPTYISNLRLPTFVGSLSTSDNSLTLPTQSACFAGMPPGYEWYVHGIDGSGNVGLYKMVASGEMYQGTCTLTFTKVTIS